jgi:integrase/recombinase XerD
MAYVMEIEDRVSAKCSLTEVVKDYLDTLHNSSEQTKRNYVQHFNTFIKFLEKKGIKTFESVTRKDIEQYLSTKKAKSTKNLDIFIIKNFFTKYLNKEDLVKNLHQKVAMEEITPAELLTPQEVMAIATEAGKRTERNKVIVLALFESCARISELLQLKIGDVVFSTVTNKEGERKLIATLHFKRSKGNVKKQPVTLSMFASDLKRWIENHPQKNDGQAYLFPSPYDNSYPISDTSIAIIIQEAGERIGISKRLNPHFFRHSGLSYFVNDLNYNEQCLMYRGGWTTTAMTKRYVHSGAEIETKAYLERMGYVISEKKTQKITAKNCPHCQAINPYTNTRCDCCAMPLAIDEYKAEIEKRRNTEALFQNLDKLHKKKLTDTQQAQLNHCSETVKKLLEMGRHDLANQYLELLLTTWVRMFLL